MRIASHCNTSEFNMNDQVSSDTDFAAINGSDGFCHGQILIGPVTHFSNISMILFTAMT